MQKYYDVFHRTWWKWLSEHRVKVPEIGEKYYIQRHVTWTDARELCKKWNTSHEPGELSDKAEFQESEE